IKFVGVGILSWVTWLPAVGALILLFFNKARNDRIRWFANLWIVVCFLISVPLLTGIAGRGAGYDRGLGGLQFIEDHDWIPFLGARYQLGVDGLSLVLVMLTTLLGVVSVVCSWAYIREKGREKEYYIMLLLLQTGMLGAFVAADLFLFFVFWEVMLVPMYFLIDNALARVDGKAKVNNQPLPPEYSRGSFNIAAMTAIGPHIKTVYGLSLVIWLFIGFGLSFAIKVPMFPFHTWLPDAH